jgi:hypothetical protein
MKSQVWIKKGEICSLEKRIGTWETMHMCIMGLNVRAEEEAGGDVKEISSPSMSPSDGWMDGWTHACNGKRIMLHHRKRLCTLTILLFLPCFIVHFNSHLYQPHSTKNASTFLSSWPLIPQTKFLIHIVARCLDAFCSEPNLWQAFFFFSSSSSFYYYYF